MMVVGLFFSFALLPSVGHTTDITFENCQLGTWVGGVKWEWKDGARGNYEGATYKDIPELELKSVGSLVIDLEPGDYAITHYRPKYAGEDRIGRLRVIPSAILEFREIEVGTLPQIHSFGCEE
jgi:hypothetical protein